MTALADLADLDAAIAEAELDDDTADRLRELVREGATIPQALEQIESERAGAPDAKPPAEPATGEPTEKQLESFDREQARHEKRVHEIMGELVADFVACETCSGVGLVPPGPPPPQPKTHPYFVTCETCNGFGQVLTGSHREGKTARDCPDCKGDGYLEALDESGQPRAGIPGVQAAPTATALPTAGNGTEPPPPATPATPAFGKPAWMGNV